MSPEARQKLRKLGENVGGMMQEVKRRAQVSGLLAYADMAQVDRASALWQAWLLPLAKRCGGPPSQTPLITVAGEWKLQSNKPGSQFTSLREFMLKNVCGRELTHAAIELIAENEWGEKIAQYYFFHKLDVAEAARLVPHPRWLKRRLPFTNIIKLKWSVWADQGSEVDRTATLTNPTPNPDPVGWRKDYLAFDRQYQAEGEALGAIVRNMKFLPVLPDRQRRRLLDCVAQGSTYMVPQSNSGKPVVMRFQNTDAGQGTVEVEIMDATSRKPLRPDAPVWRGKLKPDPDAGFVLSLDSGWTLQLAPDDQPTISIPNSGNASVRQMPMVRIKLP
jgi:hypothetical protein